MTIRVSPSAENVPGVSGQSGKYLTTDGNSLSWGSISAGGMTSLASGSLAASSTGVDLQSISGIYNELVLYINGWSVTAANQSVQIRLNNDTGTTYSFQRLATNNASITNTTGNTGVFPITNTTSVAAHNAGTVIARFPNYKNTTASKTIQTIATDDTTVIYGLMGIWNNTAAINRIAVLSSGTFDAGTYELFGVR